MEPTKLTAAFCEGGLVGGVTVYRRLGARPAWRLIRVPFGGQWTSTPWAA